MDQLGEFTGCGRQIIFGCHLLQNKYFYSNLITDLVRIVECLSSLRLGACGGCTPSKCCDVLFASLCLY